MFEEESGKILDRMYGAMVARRTDDPKQSKAAKLLQRGRPPYTRLLDLEPKLRCSSRGNRQGNSLSVSMAPRN